MLRFAVLIMLLTGSAYAQPYPSKPVRVVVPWPPGGVTDVLTRAVAAQVGESLGQQVLVENRPGAGGTLGVAAVAKAPPDGHTLVMTDVPSHAISATLYPKLPYDVVRDFEAVAMVAGSPMVLTTHPGLNVRDLREFLQAARARPGQLSYASSGNGAITHLAMERPKRMAGIDLVHVPYKDRPSRDGRVRTTRLTAAMGRRTRRAADATRRSRGQNEKGALSAEDHIDLQPILNITDHDAGGPHGVANILLGAAPVLRPGTKLGRLADVNP